MGMRMYCRVPVWIHWMAHDQSCVAPKWQPAKWHARDSPFFRSMVAFLGNLASSYLVIYSGEAVYPFFNERQSSCWILWPVAWRHRWAPWRNTSMESVMAFTEQQSYPTLLSGYLLFCCTDISQHVAVFHSASSICRSGHLNCECDAT